MIYWSTANAVLRFLYPSWRWNVPAREKKIYLSFDDGPHPTITPFVLEQLALYKARATFFCIGKNVREYPAVYEKILNSGHAIGNHTMHHRNGWKTSDDEYFNDIAQAGEYIDSKLFRPPYGKLSRFQGKALSNAGWEIVMWTVLSGDFDRQKSPSDCWEIVCKNVQPGSIVLFHDSEKAWDRLREVLPKTLAHFSAAGFTFEQLSMNSWR
ncbi:polysaccharide deacetylase family protein [Flavihumibacter profundi]|uniref:polysaccharide deacetylase family protein n=1 Tax=Flavihumibacter profundi TaxID=2716883 RepID=UPI001CC74153|nr:polysaccharide deacetylase family protein [Flavihumibacter profundi]MBZ5858464.1 polysaccharide deacetylase family protein [Flavihumibacter profundi]